MTFKVPLGYLPDDLHERFELLHEYFCDQRCSSFQENNHWVLTPFWPKTPEYLVDPNISTHLNWWDPGIKINDLHKEVREMDGYQLSLNDSWTLYSWSKWLQRYTIESGMPDVVTILHVDYHNDLMSPRLVYGFDAYADLLTGESFDIKDPHSVKNAILSGAVGVGSFMVPFLHSIKEIHIRHLAPKHVAEKVKGRKLLRRCYENDTLLDLQKVRPAVVFETNDENSETDYSIKYKITHILQEWLHDVPEAPILLHIDMDYFNCRYDGDSDWQKHLPRYDPEFSMMLEKMELIFADLKKLKRKINDLAVAISPGFFPSEFWQSSIEKISQLVLE